MFEKYNDDYGYFLLFAEMAMDKECKQKYLAFVNTFDNKELDNEIHKVMLNRNDNKRTCFVEKAVWELSFNKDKLCITKKDPKIDFVNKETIRFYIDKTEKDLDAIKSDEKMPILDYTIIKEINGKINSVKYSLSYCLENEKYIIVNNVMKSQNNNIIIKNEKKEIEPLF